jgi:hypothetical protein
MPLLVFFTNNLLIAHVCYPTNPHFSCSAVAIVLQQQHNSNIFLLPYKLKFHFISFCPLPMLGEGLG